MKENLVVGGEKDIIPDVVGKVTAYRVFDFENDNLISPHKLATWNDRRIEAECKKDLHSQQNVPEKDCSCGLYGFKDIKHIKQNWFYNSYIILAITEHWGRTVVHEDGLRSQYASVKAVTVNQNVGPSWKMALDLWIICFTFLGFILFFGSTATTLGIIFVCLTALGLLIKFSLKLYLNFQKRHNLKLLKTYAKENNVIFCKNIEQLQKHHTNKI